MSGTVVVELPAQPSAARAARHAVRDALTDWGLEPLVDDAMLLTSELVTNAVLHASSAPVLTVVQVGQGSVRLEVADQSDLPPRPHLYGVTSTTGRGVRLLDSLARDWGTEPTDPGKRVWVLLDVDHAAHVFDAAPAEVP